MIKELGWNQDSASSNENLHLEVVRDPDGFDYLQPGAGKCRYADRKRELWNHSKCS